MEAKGGDVKHEKGNDIGSFSGLDGFVWFQSRQSKQRPLLPVDARRWTLA